MKTNLYVSHRLLEGTENTVEPIVNTGSSNIRKIKYVSESCNTLDYIQEVIRDTLETIVLEDSHLSVYFGRYDIWIFL